jgi:hypothetical protein
MGIADGASIQGHAAVGKEQLEAVNVAAQIGIMNGTQDVHVGGQVESSDLVPVAVGVVRRDVLAIEDEGIRAGRGWDDIPGIGIGVEHRGGKEEPQQGTAGGDGSGHVNSFWWR